MNYLKYISAILFLLLFCTCNDEELIAVSDLLQNDKGWYAYEHRRAEIGESQPFRTNQPYIIIGEYGSGFKIGEDGVCHINYSDGSAPIGEETVTRCWKLNGEEEIIFSSVSSEDIRTDIVEISSDFLWIRYEQSGDYWEYKLKRIE